jgi:hypothetical protein
MMLSDTPRVVRGAIVAIDVDTSAVLRVIALQYNPDTVTRTLQVHAVGDQRTDRSQPLRLTAPPSESIKVDAEIDATDQLEVGDGQAVTLGIHPQLAALETLLYPTSAQLLARNDAQSSGTLEIAPMESPLTLFVWSKQRIIPVRLTDLSVTEEAFDVGLNPLRAKVSLSMKVLSVNDLGFMHKGGSLYMVYQQTKEALAAQAPGGQLSALGIGGLP